MPKIGLMLALSLVVALRKESVDRNGLGFCYYCNDFASLSARRAWIEISTAETAKTSKAVALRKESVDRNMGAS